jgi:hypothetical protein
MRAVTAWPAPGSGGGTREEAALVFDRGRKHRLLVVPPLFDEANKFRRQLVEIMHRLDLSGIDSFLPDMPGTNESLLTQSEVTLEILRTAASAASEHFRTTHCFCVRSGALYAPTGLPGWRYAPIAGRNAVRALLRARSIASQEAGNKETMAALSELAAVQGIVAAGWQLGSSFYNDLIESDVPTAALAIDIDHETVGGSPLWLRAEPDEDPEQADALAAIIAIGLTGQ